ncbi:hypothetical protein Tco_1321009, partial [Tanacetum coccineum]
VKMEDTDITIDEYIQLEAEKAYRRGHMFNWETATYGKVRYFEDIDYFKDFETKFSAIVYNDALTSKSETSPELAISPNNDKKVDFEISFSEFDDEDYTFTNDENLFSYKLIYINDLKPDSGNDNDKVNVELSSDDIPIEPLDSVIDANIDTYSFEFDENFEMSHDISGKSFTIKDFVIMIKIMIRMLFNEGMPFIFIIKNLCVPFGIPFDPK